MKPLTKAQRVAVAQVIVDVIGEGDLYWGTCEFCEHYEPGDGGTRWDGNCGSEQTIWPVDADDSCGQDRKLDVERIAADLRKRLEAQHEAQ